MTKRTAREQTISQSRVPVRLGRELEAGIFPLAQLRRGAAVNRVGLGGRSGNGWTAPWSAQVAPSTTRPMAAWRSTLPRSLPPHPRCIAAGRGRVAGDEHLGPAESPSGHCRVRAGGGARLHLCPSLVPARARRHSYTATVRRPGPGRDSPPRRRAGARAQRTIEFGSRGVPARS
jgi:hypothetical protein